jgi:hypothetical protein
MRIVGISLLFLGLIFGLAVCAPNSPTDEHNHDASTEAIGESTHAELVKESPHHQESAAEKTFPSESPSEPPRTESTPTESPIPDDSPREQPPEQPTPEQPTPEQPTPEQPTPEQPTPPALPVAGNPNGNCAIPAEAQLEDISNPRSVVGNGTPQSCTSDAFVNAVARGGVITFNCGAAHHTIKLTRTAKIVNDTGPRIVIDGGGKITLDGDEKHRILYQNTCDQAQKWTTPHCQDQDHPRLTVQRLTFIRGNAKGLDPYGGGAIFVRGGRFKIIESRFFNNTCDDTGPDVGGAAVRVLSQHNNQPVYVVRSTFGGRQDLGNRCSNGGGLSSIGVSFTVLNSLFSFNDAIGHGANPAKPNTPGGGSGGAIYNDGNLFTLELCGVHMHDNTAKEGGGAIFFVSNNRTGKLIIRDSLLERNPSAGFETRGFPGIFVLADGPPQVTNSTIR